MEQNNNQNLPAVQQAPAPAPIPATSIFSEMTAFENAQRVAKMLAASSLVPQQFQGNVPNVMIALEMANRLNASPFMVMQNMYIVHGRPGFSATYVIASINACGRFSPLRFEINGEGDDRSCYAWVIEKSTGERLEGSPVSIRMAKAEGWWSKKDRNGNETSKWQTMPEQMLRYRAAAFFGRLYAPDILMGMQTAEEAEDIAPAAAPASWTPPSAPPAPSQVEANVIDAEVVERRPAEPLAGVDAINAMLEAAPTAESQDADQESSGRKRKARRANPENLAKYLDQDARPEQSAEAPAEQAAEDEPPHPAEAATENAEPASGAQTAEPEEHKIMVRYIRELDEKAGMSELRGWADRHRQRLAKELGGENSEFFQAVVEHWKGLVEALPPQQ